MTIRKMILPHNLPGLEKFFDNQIKEVKKKLHGINKQKSTLEKKLTLLEDGKDFCRRVYDISKANTKADETTEESRSE